MISPSDSAHPHDYNAFLFNPFLATGNIKVLKTPSFALNHALNLINCYGKLRTDKTFYHVGEMSLNTGSIVQSLLMKCKEERMPSSL